VEIRPPRDDDFAAIADITNHYIETSTIHFAYQPVTAESLLEHWHAARGRFPWLVAEDGGAVVAYAKAGTWRDREAYDWTAEVGLYVHHEAHRRGIGRRLYAELLAELGRRGFRSAIGGIALPNDASEELHRALGFEPVGTVLDAGWKHGRWCDVAFWQKRLATGAGEPPSR